MKITQNYLKERFLLDRKKWVLIYRKTCGKMKAGEKAGYVDKDSGYVGIIINKKKYKAHRLIWLYVYGSFPKKDIDHINGVKNDNNINNLRDVSSSVNNKNSRIRKDNKTGTTGVIWDKCLNRFVARIMVNKKNITLGLFKEIYPAILARKKAEKKYNFGLIHGKII